MEKKGKGFSKSCVKSYVLHTILPAFVLMTITVLSVMPLSCRTSIEGIDFLSGDFTVPRLTGFEVVDSYTVSASFSKDVCVDSVCIKAVDGGNSGEVSPLYDVENRRVDFKMSNKMETGKKYLMDVMVEDSNGNSVTICVDFPGYNDRVPALALSEIRIKNKSSSDKSEFVELYALTSGNLSGLEIVSAADGEEKKYEFPPVEVSAGEYIVVHMRNGTEGCIDEVDNNLKLATTTDSSPSARDLFAKNENDGRFGTSADIIVLKNSASGKILDTFVYADSSKNNVWSASLESFAPAVEDSGTWAWENGSGKCNIDSAFITSTLNRDSHTACRRGVEKLDPKNLAGANSQWYEVTTTKAQTPGRRN